IQVTNITSHTLGVVLWDEVHLEEYVFPMIRKMTAIPARARNSFGTAMSNMQRAVVRVVEGESTLPGECTPLGICDVELPAFLTILKSGMVGVSINRPIPTSVFVSTPNRIRLASWSKSIDASFCGGGRKNCR